MKKVFVVAVLAGVSILSSCGGGMSEEELQNTIDELTAELEEVVEEEELFVSEDGHFTIDFLGGNPSDQASTIPTDVGDVEMHMYMYERSVTEAFMVAYSDYPSDMVNESDGADVLLQGAKNGAFTNLGIIASDEEKTIEINGHPGLFFTGNNGQYYVSYEVYLVENRLYQVAILRDGSYASNKDVEDFTGSFKLTNQGDEEE